MSAPVPSRPSEVRTWCAENGFHPNRTLGQNFLIDLNTIESIVAFAGIGPGDRVLEVGPGLGAITRAMLDAGASVVAIEKDRALAALLTETFADNQNFTLFCADMLDVPLDALLTTGSTSPTEGTGAECGGKPYFDKFVSNLPYSVGTRILLDMCRHPLAPGRFAVMVQKEVADRLVAGPDSKERGLASVRVQQSYTPKAFKTIKPTCFWPRPEIASTVVGLSRHGNLPLADKELAAFESITKIAFMHRRKQMSAIFRSAGELPLLADAEKLETWLRSASLDPRTRPEAITNEQWHRLAQVLAEMEDGI